MTTTTEEIVPRIELTRKGFITNYPPYRYWRSEVAQRFLETRPLNIYVHTPYCIQRCAYCHYKTTTLSENRKAEIDRYVAALCREIELASQRFHLKDRATISVYFGGGTPTLLSRDNFSQIMTTLRDNLSFADPEITVEGEPVTLTQAKADLLREMGVNRVSLGIQSFVDEVVAKTDRRGRQRRPDERAGGRDRRDLGEEHRARAGGRRALAHRVQDRALRQHRVLREHPQARARAAV